LGSIEIALKRENVNSQFVIPEPEKFVMPEITLPKVDVSVDLNLGRVVMLNVIIGLVILGIALAIFCTLNQFNFKRNCQFGSADRKVLKR